MENKNEVDPGYDVIKEALLGEISSCDRIRCPFYKFTKENGRECTDKDEFVSIRDGELICRFNKDAVERYDTNLIRQTAIYVIDSWLSRESMVEPIRALSRVIKYCGDTGEENNPMR